MVTILITVKKWFAVRFSDDSKELSTKFKVYF